MARNAILASMLGVLLLASGACQQSSSSSSAGAIQTPDQAGRGPSLTPVERGRLVYQKYGCALCHGPEGQGGVENPNAQTGGEIPKLIYVAEGYTPQELKAQIRKGVWEIARADSLGPPPPYRMPAMEGWMAPEELDVLVQYLRSLMPKEAEEEW